MQMTSILLTPGQATTLKHWFLPERPGPLVGSHVIQTGNGVFLVDRWPDPRAALMETAGNYSLLGAVDAFTPSDLRNVTGVVEASAAFEPLLKATFPDAIIWQRVILVQQDTSTQIPAGDHLVRRLEPSDIDHLRGLSSESAWISKTWGGPLGLASSRFGWGAFVDDQLVSVACTFFLGETYEDIGVVTEPGFRGTGLSPSCTIKLCDDIRTRGHQPSWSTSPDNLASLRVAKKLGFAVQRYDSLYVVGIPIPQPPQPPAGTPHLLTTRPSTPLPANCR